MPGTGGRGLACKALRGCVPSILGTVVRSMLGGSWAEQGREEREGEQAGFYPPILLYGNTEAAGVGEGDSDLFSLGGVLLYLEEFVLVASLPERGALYTWIWPLVLAPEGSDPLCRSRGYQRVCFSQCESSLGTQWSFPMMPKPQLFSMIPP